MDATNILLDGIKLSLRSAVIIETKEGGYIFEKENHTGIYYIVGGGIKINESSYEAAKREVYEELGLNVEKIKLKAIVERIFSNNDNIQYHNIEFFYEYKLSEEITLDKGFYVLDMEMIKNENIKPRIIYEIINSKQENLIHRIMYE